MHGFTDIGGTTPTQNSVLQGQVSSGGINDTPSDRTAKGPQSDESAWDCQRLNRAVLAPTGANHDPEGSRRMHPSPSIRGTTRVTVLPDAGREEVLAAAGLSSSAHWPELDHQHRRRSDSDEFDTDPLAPMERPTLLSEHEAAGRGFLMDGGWSVVANKQGTGGVGSHRGVLQDDEYVDSDELKTMVERELDFTIEQIHSVYRQGPLSTEQRELRGQIDARLLALSCAGGSMLELARIFGWELTAGGSSDRCKTMERAIARARQAEVTS